MKSGGQQQFVAGHRTQLRHVGQRRFQYLHQFVGGLDDGSHGNRLLQELSLYTDKQTHTHTQSSVTLQRFNAILLRQSFVESGELDLWSFQLVFNLFAFSPGLSALKGKIIIIEFL